MRNSSRKVLVAAVLLIAVLAVLFAAGNFFYNLALNPRVDKTRVFGAGHNALPQVEEMLRDLQTDLAWAEETGVDDWTTTSVDGLRLHASVLSQTDASAPWVVVCHGYSGYGLQMATSARKFHELGYNVLLPDARGCGRSEGAYFGMGWHDRHDVVRWLEEIAARHSPENIYLYGVSMGGATVMMASGEKLPGAVRAIVTDCGYSSVREEFKYQMKQLFGLPSFPLLDAASVVTRLRAGYWLGEADAVRQVAKSVTPTLFIHGTRDSFVPFRMLDEVYGAAACPKEKMVFEGAGHAGSSIADPERYWNGIEAFFKKHRGKIHGR